MNGPLALVYPVLAQVLLTFVLMLVMAQKRLTAIRARRVRAADVAMSTDAWPDDVRLIGNNVRNQFETPVLFYVLCGVATYVAAVGIGMTLLAWAYVATRVMHAVIHTTSNDLRQRFFVFLASMAILMIMWVIVVVRLLSA